MNSKKIMNKKKIISLLLVMGLIVTSITGCGKKDGDSKGADATNPDEKVTLTYWIEFSPSQAIKSLNESEMYKELEKRTGVHIEFIHPAEGQAQEQFNIMINSNDMPDIIQDYGSAYPGGVDKAINDGAFIKLNDLIDKYAPNFKKLRESDKNIAQQTITDEGNIWGFPCIQTMDEPAWHGPEIRKDWLDELGLKIPTTIDEWHTALKAFKEKKNVQAPLMMNKSGVDYFGVFVGAYDIGPYFYQKDGVVKYGPYEPEFKDYLTTMNKWYKEGLIDKDFATRDNKSKEAMITSGKAGVFMGPYGSVDTYSAALKSADPKGQFAAAPYPSLKPGENVHYREVDYNNKGYEAVITSSCKHPEEAVKWFDYAYSPEGAMLYNYGIEDVSYKMVDGKPQFTDLMTKNPDGDYWTIQEKYKRGIGPYLRDWAACPPFSPESQDCMDTWSKAEYDYCIPMTSMTAEENDKYSSVMTEINTFKGESILKFITGAEPLSKFDNYINQLKKMGIEDAIKIQQDALDRFNKR